MKTLNLCIPTIILQLHYTHPAPLTCRVFLLPSHRSVSLFSGNLPLCFFLSTFILCSSDLLLPFLLSVFASYLRQPAVLASATSHSRCLGLQVSSPPPALLLPCSQPEWGTMTSSERACSAWSTISIFTESWDDRFHSVPGSITGFEHMKWAKARSTHTTYCF